MSDKMKILIIEDDKEIANLLSVYLTQNGYETAKKHDGVGGLNELKAHAEEYGMILLDMMLPGFSGDELLPRFRTITDIPVIVISAISALDQRLMMMRTGADDYIIKPFELPDVLVRIEAVARRYRINLLGTESNAAGSGSAATNALSASKNPDASGSSGNRTARVLTYGNIALNPEDASVLVKGQPISLTAKEYEILLLFLENPTKLFSKANLYKSIWNEEYYPEDKSLNVHMSNLRSKLRKLDDFDYIETIWGMGYRLRKNG